MLLSLSHEDLSGSGTAGRLTPPTSWRSSAAGAMSYWAHVRRSPTLSIRRQSTPVARALPHATVSLLMLLLLGGVELNPGPAQQSKQTDSIRVGTLNARSAVHKGPLIRDIIDEHKLNVLIITESWFSSDMSAAITDSC